MISYSSISSAYNLISKYTIRTDVLATQYENVHLYLKLCNQQTTGSFKLRGATHKILKAGQVDTVSAVSSGNHGQAVALAAKNQGIKAHIYVPNNCVQSKADAIAAYGAKLIRFSEPFENVEMKVRQNTDALYISPYNDPDVIAGQGTVGLELAEQTPRIDTV